MSTDSPVRQSVRSGFKADSRGQSETIAIVLILAITVFGTGSIVMLGSGAIGNTERVSELQSTEHAMTLFDSTSAVVALGDSPSKTVDLGVSGSGAYEVRDSGWIRIEHVNYTGNGAAETIYNESLGSFVYVNGDTAIAYEGGGVWRREDGGSVMVSPPEFHYREATLTLPIVRVHGSGSTPGGDVRISQADETRRIYPNASAGIAGDETGAPYDGTDWNYTNPVRNGEINVTVHSDYYGGWATYFRTRTDGNVTVDHANETATVQLVTVENVGDFRMPNEGNGVKVRGMGSGHPVTNFRMTLKSDEGNSFNNLHWSLYSDSGSEEFEYHVYANDKCKGNGGYDGTLDVSIYYHDGGDETYEGWQNRSIVPGDPGSGEDFVVNCDDGTLTMNLGSDVPLEYGPIQTTGSDNKWYFGPEIKSRSVPGETTFDQHDADDDDDPYATGETAELGFLTSHYFGRIGPSFDLTVADGPGGSSRVDEGESYGTLEYEQTTGSRYITFLHITENEIRVEVE